MSISSLEKELDTPIDKIIYEFCCVPDYMGCYLSTSDIADMAGIGRMALSRLAKKLKISIPPFRHKTPTRTEDKCWTKYGISLDAYLKTRYQWKTNREMGQDLGLSRKQVKKLLEARKLTGRIYEANNGNSGDWI